MKKRVGRERSDKLPANLRNMPRFDDQKTRLYVIGLANGQTKIGYALRLRNRIISIHRWAPVVWLHVFSPFERAREAEVIALEKAAAIAEQIGRSEYFVGLMKEDAIACVRAAMNEVRAAEDHPVTYAGIFTRMKRGERTALAQKVGVSAAFLSQIATGKRRPSLATAMKMAKVDPRLDIERLIWELGA